MFKFKTNAMAALVLGLGLLTACSSNDELGNGTDTAPNGSTYMSVAINLSTGSGTRADADNQKDTEESDKPDYNFVGKWAGKDKIKAIEVYVFDASNKLEANEEFAAGQFQVQGAAADNSVTIAPSKGIKVLPGNKTVYVVVNPTQETKDFLPHDKGTTTLDAFKVKYENVADAAGNFLAPANTGNAHTNVKTSADGLAAVDGDNTDVITMTAIEAATNVDVKDNVSEKATLAGNTTNRANLTVKRAVARVMVTTTATEFIVKGDDALTQGVVEPDAELGKVTKIKYVVGQGEKSIYFMQRQGGIPELTYKTPNSDYKTNKDYTWTNVGPKYDYSGLWKGYDDTGAENINGITVPTKTLYNSVAGTALENIKNDLVAQLNGEFILPNTHKWGDTQDASDYRKGNTAYVLVRAQFQPKRVVKEDGTIYEDYSYPAGKDFYLGANGIFYESITAAHDAAKKGVAKQDASLYVKGKTLYYAWINPDKTGAVEGNKWINSPVNRNNIYHIEISGFKRIGTNWNPLVPSDDPEPNPNDPNNPDPKPDNPNEPDEPSVDPDDPLTPKETWMSVETKILPWNVHSYSVELDM